jgi:hypothetical protein
MNGSAALTASGRFLPKQAKKKKRWTEKLPAHANPFPEATPVMAVLAAFVEPPVSKDMPDTLASISPRVREFEVHTAAFCDVQSCSAPSDPKRHDFRGADVLPKEFVLQPAQK